MRPLHVFRKKHVFYKKSLRIIKCSTNSEPCFLSSLVFWMVNKEFSDSIKAITIFYSLPVLWDKNVLHYVIPLAMQHGQTLANCP